MPQDKTTIYQHFEVLCHPDGSLWELGRGNMGVTYRAFDTNLRKKVALKVITGTLLPDANARERFVREARAAAQLQHSNVAAIYHLGQDTESCFYTMELIEGETCTDLVTRVGPLHALHALRIVVEVASVLQQAQRLTPPLLHRDLKPDNLMVRPEGDEIHVKVIDFGLAKVLHPDNDPNAGPGLTLGRFVGTPDYASPEQCAQENDLDGRSDLYSLGANLFFLLTSETLFRGTANLVMLQQISKPPPLEKLAGQPRSVVELLTSLLAKERHERPDNAGILRARILKIIRDLETTIPSLPPLPPPPKPEPISPIAPVRGPVANEQPPPALDKLAPLPDLIPEVPPAPPTAFEPTPARAGESLENLLRRLDGKVSWTCFGHLLDALAPIVDLVTPDGTQFLDLTPRGIWFAPANTPLPDGFDPRCATAFEDAELFGGILQRIEISHVPSLDASETVGRSQELNNAGYTILASRPSPDSPVQALAILSYELLNGLPPPSAGPYKPLPALDEAGNDVIRTALANAQGIYKDAAFFVKILTEKAADFRRTVVMPPPDPSISASPQTGLPDPLRFPMEGIPVGTSDGEADKFASDVAPMTVTSLIAEPNIQPEKSHDSTPVVEPQSRLAQIIAVTVVIAITAVGVFWRSCSHPTPPPPSPSPVISPTPSLTPTPTPPTPTPPTPTPPTPTPPSDDSTNTPESLPSLFARARQYMTTMLWHEAAEMYSRVLILKPDSIEALDERATAYDLQGADDKATADYGRVILLEPKDARDHFYRGDAYLQLDQNEKAVADFQTAITLIPIDARDYCLRGLAYSNLQKYDSAIQDFSEAINLDPKDARSYFFQGDAYQSLHTTESDNFAIKSFSGAILLNPLYVPSWYRRGLIYAAKGDSKQSISDFTECLRLQPKNEEAIRERAFVYFKAGASDLAISELSKAIHLNPRDETAWASRSFLYIQVGKFDLAIPDATEAIRLDGDDANAWNHRGWAHIGKHDYDLGISDLDKSIQLNPQLASAWNNRGFAYANKKKPDYRQAIHDFDRAISINPEFAIAYKNRAAAKRSRGGVADAKRDDEKAAELEKR